MSKTPSLDIKSIYQIGLVIIGIASAIVVLLNCLDAISLFRSSKAEPALKAREQQLNQAINLTQIK